MDISVLIERKYRGKVDENWLQDVISQTLTAEKVQAKAEVSLMITSQEKIRQLNLTYREIDEPTDVLSFGMMPETTAESGLPFVTAPDGLQHLGEVIISYPQAELQADQHGHSIKTELATLIIHGILHLLDYDHAEPDDEARMKVRETDILKQVEAKEEK